MKSSSAVSEPEMRRARVDFVRRLWLLFRKLDEADAAKEALAAVYRPLSRIAGTLPPAERLAAGGTLERAL